MKSSSDVLSQVMRFTGNRFWMSLYLIYLTLFSHFSFCVFSTVMMSRPPVRLLTHFAAPLEAVAVCNTHTHYTNPHTQTHLHIHTHAHKHTYTHTYLHKHALRRTCPQAQKHTHTRTHKCTRTCMHTHTNTKSTPVRENEGCCFCTTQTRRNL